MKQICLSAAGHVECVRLLVHHGADVNLPDVKAQSPLMMAVKNRHIACVRELLLNGSNPNGDQNSLCSPLYIAAMDGFTEALQVEYLAPHFEDLLCQGWHFDMEKSSSSGQWKTVGIIIGKIGKSTIKCIVNNHTKIQDNFNYKLQLK